MSQPILTPIVARVEFLHFLLTNYTSMRRDKTFSQRKVIQKAVAHSPSVTLEHHLVFAYVQRQPP